MSRKVAIVQSNYIPWKGYFDLIAAVDICILYDEVQFTKNDWRNRNQIKTSRGLEWLSIPVGQDIRRRIREVQLPDARWQRQHWERLTRHYREAAYFDEVAAWLEPLYGRDYQRLSEVNRCFIEAINAYIGIATPLRWSWEYEGGEGRTERLVEICRQERADIYVSGPKARDYLDTTQFTQAGIQVAWFDYQGYPEYPQFHPPFVHTVTILDLLFHSGKNAPQSMLLGRS